jgi:hypothetical protein
VSNRLTPCVKEFKACIAFDNTGNYTKEVKKLMEKYNLSKRGIETTADSHRKFCQSLFLRTTGIVKDKLNFSPKIMEELEYYYNIRRKEMREEIEKDRLYQEFMGKENI